MCGAARLKAGLHLGPRAHLPVWGGGQEASLSVHASHSVPLWTGQVKSQLYGVSGLGRPHHGLSWTVVSQVSQKVQYVK